jgi:hypothetical protein
LTRIGRKLVGVVHIGARAGNGDGCKKKRGSPTGHAPSHEGFGASFSPICQEIRIHKQSTAQYLIEFTQVYKKIQGWLDARYGVFTPYERRQSLLSF